MPPRPAGQETYEAAEAWRCGEKTKRKHHPAGRHFQGARPDGTGEDRGPLLDLAPKSKDRAMRPGTGPDMPGDWT